MIDELRAEYRLLGRLFWLIRLRWIAVVGVVVTVFFAINILKLSLPSLTLYFLALVLGLYNFIFFLISSRAKRKKGSSLFLFANRIANVQISLDLFILTVLIHFSGGIGNPFIFYFIFHIIIASILLSRRASFLQATFAVILFCSLTSLEYSGILAHYSLAGFIPYTLGGNLRYILGISFVFSTTLYIAVYMATSISVKLREREKNLQQANVLLREKDRIKSEYVLRVSHDIKEHLSSIQSCIQPVTAGITGPLNEKQEDLLRTSEGRTRKLLFFVDALLDITRLKLSKGLKMEFFSFPGSLKAICNDIAGRAKQRNITFHVEVDPAIKELKGVRIYLEETISNILSNALKYTLSGGKVSLKVEDKPNKVLIQIADTGIGIPADEIKFIFDEFYRAGNAKKMERIGTGLGLSIAKEVVRMHQGRIWVESELGKGTKFFIELPKKIKSEIINEL